MDSIKTAFNVREQLHGFLGIFSAHFSKPKLRFVEQMLFGIQAAQDVKLSRIGRALEEDIPIGKTENRLSRNLAMPGMAAMLQDAILDWAVPSIHKETLVIVDPSDIQKDYAKKMPYLAKVWDGSRGDVGENLGYSGCMAVACESGARKMTPLLFKLWSSAAPGFKSENCEVEAAIDAIAGKAKGRGIYVYDRGGDRIGLFEHFLDRELRFIVRLVGKRNIVWRKKEYSAEKLADKCRMQHATSVSFISDGKDRKVHIQFGAMNVRLPGRPDVILRLVVVKGFGKKPMLLLSNLIGTDSYKDEWKIVEGYLTRWRVEDAIRFIKQSYRLEEMRLLDYDRLKNMVAMVLCAAVFAASWMGLGDRLKIMRGHVLALSRRIHKMPDFFYYALADGISALFRNVGRRWKAHVEKPPDANDTKQLLLKLDFAPQ